MFIGTLLKHGLQGRVTEELSRRPSSKVMLMQPGIIGLLSLLRGSDCLLTPPTPCPKTRSSTSSRKKFLESVMDFPLSTRIIQ